MGCGGSKPNTDLREVTASDRQESDLKSSGRLPEPPATSEQEVPLEQTSSGRREPRACSSEEIRQATNGFSRDRRLGKGAFGEVWKGTMSWAPDVGDLNGFNVAVKKLFEDGDAQAQTIWIREAQQLLSLFSRHPNIVTLLGYNYSDSVLVFPLYVHGSLLEALAAHAALTWPQRVNIALDCAQALQFLHKEEIMHRNVKPSNILLDSSFRAHLSDFGLAKEGTDGTLSHASTAILGDLGYMDPEYYMMSRLTFKSDVYAFGVVLVVLMAGRDDVTRDLREWALNSGASRTLEQKMDRRLNHEYDRDQALKMLDLAKSCLHQDGSQRPHMAEVVRRIEELKADS